MTAFGKARYAFAWFNEVFPILVGIGAMIWGFGSMFRVLPDVPGFYTALAGTMLAIIALHVSAMEVGPISRYDSKGGPDE